MKRREFLQLSTIGAATTMAAPWARSAEGSSARWRVFELTTQVDVLFPVGATRVWLPVPLREDTDWQKGLGDRWTSDRGDLVLASDPAYGAAFVSAAWPQDSTASLTLTSRVATRDRSVDVTRNAAPAALDPVVARRYTHATSLLPTDGIVLETAQLITRGAQTDVECARALYDWICDNTFRDPKVRGCGTGNIKFMLESRNLGGKCADLNALFVGMARSLGIPARDVYGIRVASSASGYKSLGPVTPVISKSQHCRAEFYDETAGWVPVDPADVRKVVLEEQGGIPLDDPTTRKARAKLFGQWEMNWLAYNTGNDVSLPGAGKGTIPFLMYPQSETGGQRVDSLDADNFKYTITSKELA